MPSRDHPSSVPDEPRLLSREQLSQLLDVPESAICSWERRYHLTSAVRQPDGSAGYSSDAIRVLRHVRDYTAAGHGTAAIASMADALRPPSVAQLIAALLTAVEHRQPAAVGQALDAARQVLGLDRTVDDVLLPALRTIGERWADRMLDVAQEHAASEAVHAWLSSASCQVDVPVRPQPIVLACAPSEQHTLALESLGALLRRRGWNCLLLGARTPIESLSRTISDVGPAAVVVVAHLPRTRRSAARALRRVRAHQTPLFVAGNAFRSRNARLDVPGTYLGERIAGAADLISATLTSGTMAR